MFKTERLNGKRTRALAAAFPFTLPILAGFGFLGITYGILMSASGFGIGYSLAMSIFVFAGSMEFVAVDILLGAFSPIETFLMTLMVNARHLFYGIAMLDKYRDTGKKKPYLIFGMCDESFSINYSADIPKDVDRGLFMFFVTLLNQIYWVAGTAVGAIFGSVIHFNTEGLDFVMTAMFTVIFLDNLLKEKNHIPSILGLALSLVCLIIFGSDYFLIPAMLCIFAALLGLKRPLTKDGAV